MVSKRVEIAKKRFSEPELFLLTNWANARLLEQSMEGIREKYAEVFGKVLDAVEEEHQELENRAVHTAVYGGSVGIAKQAWPSLYPGWPSGLWVGSIALEKLVTEDETAPEAYISVEPSKEMQLDMQRAGRKLRDGAEKILGKKQMKGKGVWIEVKKKAYLSYKLPEPRHELLELLLCDNGDGFIKRMVEHFEALARFIPVLDDIFASGRRRR